MYVHDTYIGGETRPAYLFEEKGINNNCNGWVMTRRQKSVESSLLTTFRDKQHLSAHSYVL